MSVVVTPNDVRAFVLDAIETRPPKEQDVLDCIESALYTAAYEQRFPLKTGAIYVGYADVNRELEKRGKDRASDESINEAVEMHYVRADVWDLSKRKLQQHIHVSKPIGWLFTERRH